jgi:hypothetical protein
VAIPGMKDGYEVELFSFVVKNGGSAKSKLVLFGGGLMT